MPFSRYLNAARSARYLAVASGSLLGACAPDGTVAPSPAPVRSDLLIEHIDGDRTPPRTPWQDAVDSAVAAAGAGDVGALQRRIESAATGLLYTSESDYPLVYVRSATAVATPVQGADVPAAFGADPDAPVGILSLDDFFARHIERVDLADEVALARVRDWVRLRETLRHALTGVRVYRIGSIAVDCLVVGLDRQGHLVGVRTTAIET